jgi:hypothetical protein
MPQSGAETKAKLLARLEASIDKALEQADKAERLTITDIEEIALQARAEVGEQVTAVLDEGSHGASVPGPRCSRCGREMAYKGTKRRYVGTRSGDVQVARAYYYCGVCRRGAFPPG